MKTISLPPQPFGRSEGCAARTSQVQKKLAQVKCEPWHQTTSLHGWYVPVKAALDWGAACVLLIIATPIILISAVAIVLTSRGPAFYCQRRVGKGGREFTLIKLRTMRLDAELSSGPVWSVGADPRVTPLGRFLRETHLDELPQLINVLLGHMSLVGPRPERPPFVLQVREEIPFYGERVNVRPGITGLSQMRLPADCDLDSVRKKLVHDLYYVRHVTLWLDLRILGYTAAELARSIIASLCGIFALPAQEIVEKDFYPLVHQDFDSLLFEGDDLEEPRHEHERLHMAELTGGRAQAPI